MGVSQIWAAVSIAVLAIVAVLVFVVRKGGRENRLTPLAGLAFVCVIAGVMFSDARWVGCSLLGIGIVLAIIDILTRSKGT